MPTRHSRLLALNDSRLAAYLTAADEAERARELERILIDIVQPRARAVVDTYIRSGWPIGPQDAGDCGSQVMLSVLRKLRAALALEEESVQNVDAYVTTLTRNAVRAYMRRRMPERNRLKNRLRYLFSHDARLAVWMREGITILGLQAWSGRAESDVDAERLRVSIAAASDAAIPPADAVVAALRAIGHPIRLGDLVSAYPSAGGERPEPIEAQPPERDRVEARQYLQILWREIRELPQPQRAALLLNLREPGSRNAIVLFVAVGIAELEEIAEAVGLSPARLGELWDDLPLDDLRIAEYLGLRRQQVINLRKSARERLARRMMRVKPRR